MWLKITQDEKQDQTKQNASLRGKELSTPQPTLLALMAAATSL